MLPGELPRLLLLLLLPLLPTSRLTAIFLPADVFSSLRAPPRLLLPSQQEDTTEEASHKAAVEEQLAELMEMGYHSERVWPFCDGISTVDEIVDELCLEEDEVGSRTTDAVVAAAAAS